MTNSVQQSPHVNNLIEKKRKTEGSGSALDGIQPLDNQKKAKIKPRVQVPAELRKPGEDENTMIPQDDLRQRELAAYEPLPFVPAERGLPSENENTLIYLNALRHMISQNALRLRELEASQRQLEAYQRGLRSL